jgi:hypothetical protein
VLAKSRAKGNNAYLAKQAIAYLPSKQRLIDQLDSASKGCSSCKVGAPSAGYFKIDQSETSGRTTPRRDETATRMLWVKSPSMSGANSMSALALPAQRVDASDIKRKVEAGLTSAAIAAIIVKMSRGEYYASGRPCACPDDTARNGSSCGGRSAYSRPGGAAPLCYPSDVPAAMIESYRQRQAAR